MNIDSLIQYAKKRNASDIHIEDKGRIALRVDGEIEKLNTDYVLDDYEEALKFLMRPVEKTEFEKDNDVDMAYQTKEGQRLRVNVFRKRGKMACVMRLLSDHIPSMEELNLPEVLKKFAMLQRGLVVVTGPTGSGKSTTLASIIDYANRLRNNHVITIEDPIEYVYEPDKCLISQRELGVDTKSFAAALRSSLREDPDIILVGEMRDFETISAAITAAETGHLVLSTLHTTGAAKSIDRIIDVFPPHQQEQIRTQLASVLEGVITQQLVKKIGGGRRAAFEIMVSNPSISNMIRDSKTFQINSSIQTGKREGMILLDNYLGNLVKSGDITFEEAEKHCVEIKEIKMFSGMGR